MTPTEDALLAAVDVAPADRTPRLVYADWLEDRGDPRAELVRVEEEMGLLPVFGDRFWELKPRRNELRAAAPADWLARLGYGTVCRPVFRHGIPDGWRERWRLIREFTERWYGTPMPDVGGRRAEVAGVEQRLVRELPPSLREYVAFAHDARQSADYFDFIRDVYQMRDIPGYPAISLVLQAEGDYHWAVRHDDLGAPDPPVVGYHWDFEARTETFVPDARRPVADRVTGFVLDYTMGYARGWGLFGAYVPDPDRLARDLLGAFATRTCIDGTDVYETDDIRVTVAYPPGRSASLEVTVSRPIPRTRVPAFLLGYAQAANSIGGVCGPDGEAEIIDLWFPERRRVPAVPGVRSPTSQPGPDDIPF